MKTNNGFTLIELLAVIVILAIVLAIAVPSISKIVDNIRIQAFIDNEEMLVRAAKKMVGIDENYLPKVIGETTEVKLSDLQTSKFIGTIVSPSDKNKECNGYVLITKINNDKYEYTPQLNCINDIGSLTEDGLVAHWKFDNFQETTTNLLYDNGIVNWTIGNLDTTVTRATITPNSKYLINSGSASGTFRFYIPLNKLTNGSTYTLSYKYKIKVGTVFRMNDWNDRTLVNKIDVDYNDYRYASATGTASTYTDVFRFMDFYISGNSSVEIWDVQLEQKDHSTPFVNGIHYGIANDYSSFGKHATLSINSPIWNEESVSGSGSYNFNGVNTFMRSAPINNINSNEITIISMIKPITLSGTREISNQDQWDQSPWTGWRFRQQGNKIEFKLGDGSSNIYQCSGGSLSSNVWSFVVGVWNGEKIIIYQDGIEVANCDYSFNYLGSSGSHYVGKYAGSAYYFDGSIDNLKIYNRALSEEEILHMYKTEKIK